MKTWKPLIVVLLACLWTALSALPSSANHRGEANSGVLNTRNWNICRNGPAGAVDGATDRAISLLNANTHVNADQVGCSSDSINVHVYGAAFPDAVYGTTYCVIEGASAGKCKYKKVNMNSNYCTTSSQWNKSTLHELGHVGGLGHRQTNDSAMTSGAAPPVSGSFDDHDNEALNNEYP